MQNYKTDMMSFEHLSVFIFTKLCFVWLCEAELTAFPLIGKAASQSTTHAEFVAGNAVDGKIWTFSHVLGNELHQWWQVDLGAEHCVGKIIVVLRQGCCGQYRFTGARARAGISSSFSGNQPCGSPATRAQSYDGATVQFLCDSPPRMARYVSLDIDPSEPHPEDTTLLLQLGEVSLEVYTASECAENDTPTPTSSPTPTPTPTSSPTPTHNPPELKSTNFRRLQKGASITNAELLASKQAKSLTRCASHCYKNRDCVTFEFASNGGQCRLHNLSSTYIETEPSENISIYVVE